jgi:hypothetical protein
MSLTPRSLRVADAASLDHELEAHHLAVAAARLDRWHGTDGSELRPFLSPRTKAELTYGADLAPGPAWRTRRNSWQEGLHEVN